MDDAGLMEKSAFRPEEFFRPQPTHREGLMSPSELVERRSLAKTVYMPVFTCPTCGDCHFEKVERCPRCGSRMKTLKEDKSDSSY
jgi:rubrerythrin